MADNVTSEECLFLSRIFNDTINDADNVSEHSEHDTVSEIDLCDENDLSSVKVAPTSHDGTFTNYYYGRNICIEMG